MVLQVRRNRQASIQFAMSSGLSCMEVTYFPEATKNGYHLENSIGPLNKLSMLCVEIPVIEEIGDNTKI